MPSIRLGDLGCETLRSAGPLIARREGEPVVPPHRIFERRTGNNHEVATEISPARPSLMVFSATRLAILPLAQK